MTIVTGFVRDQNGDLLSGAKVRLYRRDTGALLAEALSETTRDAVPGDTYYNNVAALLHFDGSHNSTTFTDSGPDALTITKSGTPIISTDQAVFGGAAGYFNGSSYLAIPVGAAKNIRGQPFTIEFRFRPSSATAGGGIVSTRNGATYCPLEIRQSYLGLNLYVGTAAVTGWATTGWNVGAVLSTSAWTDICVVGDGITMYIFCDGVLKSTMAQPAWTAAADTWYVGRGGDAASQCYIDELRITGGVARYTSSYTIAGEAFLDFAEILAGLLGRYQLSTTYSGEVQRIVFDPDGDPLQNDLIDRIILP